MDRRFFLDRLYPFQDQVLKVFSAVDTGFYLTDGTALSRGFLNHRFGLWSDRIITALSQSGADGWQCQILQREERFARLNLVQGGLNLKIEMVNDVPSRVGESWMHPILGRMDTAENILANKVTAVLDRSAPKDMADIWGLCCKRNLSLQEAIAGAQGKAAGGFMVDLARVLCSVTRSDWELIRWIEAPDVEQFIQQLDELGRNLIFSG
jgi:hypothetical protein